MNHVNCSKVSDPNYGSLDQEVFEILPILPAFLCILLGREEMSNSNMHSHPPDYGCLILIPVTVQHLPPLLGKFEILKKLQKEFSSPRVVVFSLDVGAPWCAARPFEGCHKM